MSALWANACVARSCVGKSFISSRLLGGDRARARNVVVFVLPAVLAVLPKYV